MKWVERAALSRQICPSAAPRCCQGWLSLGEIKWRSTKASRGRGARMIDLGTQTCNLDAIFGLLHQRPPDRRMASAPARAPNIGAPHHRSQPHHRDRCRRYRPSATLSRSADSITAVQINPRKEKGWYLPTLARCLPASRPYLPTLAQVFPIAAWAKRRNPASARFGPARPGLA